MGNEKHYLALDLGAESGRGMMGTLVDDRISLTEVHRFLTGPSNLPTMFPNVAKEKGLNDCSYTWDFIRFWQEIKESILKASKKVKLTSVGVDTWGVDFALLDKNGQLLAHPYHYRDSRTDGMMEAAFKRLPREKIYEITGIQFMQLNTLFQLLSMVESDSETLKIAEKFLMVPDLINYWLTGRAVSEFTDATTTQFFNTNEGMWSETIIEAMNFPKHIFPEIVMPGTLLGPLRESVAKELGVDLTVVAPPTHDTGSAVAAVPAEDNDYIWISSGTWSILGMNVPEPVINNDSYERNLTNEGGAAGNYRFSKNIMGLWLVQECRNRWRKEGKDLSYDALTEMARKAPELVTLVDPDYETFLKVGNMVEKINDYCGVTDQPLPKNEGEMIRAILQGLALRYRCVVEMLEEVSGKSVSTIHIVGGGTKNKLLNQFTANATGRKVITGPIEATATGNIIVQAIAMGDIEGWEEGVAVIKNSFEIETYLPDDREAWDRAYHKFLQNADKVTLAF